MKKYLYIIILCLFDNNLNAQLQLGSVQSNSASTLDVKGSPDNKTLRDGILTPRITLEQLNKKVNYSTIHKGLLLYVTDVSLTVTPKPERFLEVTSPGYYVFNGEKWLAMESKTGSVIFNGSNNGQIISNGVFSPIGLNINTNKGGGVWNTNKYKVPVSGAYLVKANLLINDGTAEREIYLSVDKVSNTPSITPYGIWKKNTLIDFTMDYTRIAYYNKDEEIALYIYSSSTNDFELSYATLDIFILSTD